MIEIADGYCVEKFVLVTNVKDIINNQINTKNQEMFVFRPYTLETEKIVSDSYHSIFRTYGYLHREINRKEKPSEIFSPIFIEFNSFKTFYKHEDFRKHFVNEAPKITKILKSAIKKEKLLRKEIKSNEISFKKFYKNIKLGDYLKFDYLSTKQIGIVIDTKIENQRSGLFSTEIEIESTLIISVIFNKWMAENGWMKFIYLIFVNSKEFPMEISKMTIQNVTNEDLLKSKIESDETQSKMKNCLLGKQYQTKDYDTIYSNSIPSVSLFGLPKGIDIDHQILPSKGSRLIIDPFLAIKDSKPKFFTNNEKILTREYRVYSHNLEKYVTNEKLSSCYSQLIGVFVLKEETFGFININEIEPTIFQKNPMDSVILDKKRKGIILSMVNSKPFELQDIVGKKMEKGKVLLFYGPPGCGKTLTIKAVAEEIQKPLIEVDSHKLGFPKPSDINQNLQKYQNYIKRWNAVLCLNEGDAFLEKRYSQNNVMSLEGRLIAATFLNALDSFKGIFMITSNMDYSQMDQAIVSRIDIIFDFKALGTTEIISLWKKLFEINQIDYTNIDLNYISNFLNLQGRHVRNFFNSVMIYSKENNEKITTKLFEDIYESCFKARLAHKY